ncbi:MAG: hypothetical protein ACXABY_00715 [Candidatus Thorarchaeota archaeon]|jgi:hypothetical protein
MLTPNQVLKVVGLAPAPTISTDTVGLPSQGTILVHPPRTGGGVIRAQCPVTVLDVPKHATAKEIDAKHPGHDLFCIVRDPMARAVSLWKHYVPSIPTLVGFLDKVENGELPDEVIKMCKAQSNWLNLPGRYVGQWAWPDRVRRAKEEFDVDLDLSSYNKPEYWWLEVYVKEPEAMDWVIKMYEEDYYNYSASLWEMEDE